MHPVCGGSPGGVTEGGSSRLLLKRGAIMKSLKKSRHPAVGRLIRRSSDAFVRPAEERWRIFLLQTRSRRLHAVAPPENMTFPLQAHHPSLKRARMTSSRHGSTSAGESQRSSSPQTHPERWQASFVVGFAPPPLCSFPLPLRRTQRKHRATNFSQTGQAHSTQVQHVHWWSGFPACDRASAYTQDRGHDLHIHLIQPNLDWFINQFRLQHLPFFIFGFEISQYDKDLCILRQL